jgi:hypothetical protein
MENIQLKENEIIISPTGKFSYQIIPLTDKTLIVDKDILKQIKPVNGTKCFDLENNCVIDYDNTEDLERERIEKLRRLREPLLVAFDKYKSNVNYGIEIETETDKINIITWYRLLLELNEYAFENVPERVKYYL